jgi:hypothetical protein
MVRSGASMGQAVPESDRAQPRRCSGSDDVQELEHRLGTAAQRPLLVARHLKAAFRKGERHMRKQTGLDGWRGDGGGDYRRGRAALDGRAHRFVRRQFERDGEIAQMRVAGLERGLQLCARARAVLT